MTLTGTLSRLTVRASARLTPAQEDTLRRLIWTNGLADSAWLLRRGQETLTNLLSGGTAKKETVQELGELLDIIGRPS